MKSEFAERYAAVETMHWWFCARRKILSRLLAKEVGWREGMRVLEVGVGPGENLRSVYPETVNVCGLEPDAKLAEIARKKSERVVHTGSVEHWPPSLAEARFDLITAFDVLEHVADDLGALRLLRTRLSAGGKLVLTVPAYQWLWSQHDVANEHHRRYTRGELTTKLTNAGWRNLRATYFNTLLFPPIAVARLLQRSTRFAKTGTSDLDYCPGALNTCLTKVFAGEACWLVHGDLPFGVSIFVVAAPSEGDPV